MLAFSAFFMSFLYVLLHVLAFSCELLFFYIPPTHFLLFFSLFYTSWLFLLLYISHALSYFFIFYLCDCQCYLLYEKKATQASSVVSPRSAPFLLSSLSSFSLLLPKLRYCFFLFLAFLFLAKRLHFFFLFLLRFLSKKGDLCFV